MDHRLVILFTGFLLSPVVLENVLDPIDSHEETRVSIFIISRNPMGLSTTFSTRNRPAVQDGAMVASLKC